MIEVAYTPSEGIVVRGTEKSQAPALKKTSDRLKWYGGGGFWYVPRTRDSVQGKWRVDRLAEDLRRALPGVEVKVSFELGDGVRPAEEIEADRKERAEARADRLEERAEKKSGEAAAAWEAGRRIADGIPMGQPILVGHHSERRHRRDIERIHSSTEKTLNLQEEAKAAAHGAKTARETVARAERPGAILRRVDRLLASQRGLERELAGREDYFPRADLALAPEDSDPSLTTFSDKWACPDGPRCADPVCLAENARRGSIVRDGAGTVVKTPIGELIAVRRFPSAQRKAELEARIAAITDEVGHLRAKLPADLPGPAKFKKGDLVAGPWGTCRVERVNPKSLSVVPLQPQWPGQKYTIPYDRNPRLLGAPEPKKEQSS